MLFRSDITFDSQDRMWLGSFGHGLWYSDDKMNTINQFKDSTGRELYCSKVVSKLLIKSNLLYVATEKDGLSEINLVSKDVSTIFLYDEDNKIPFIRDFKFITDNDIWIGSESGLYKLDLKNGAFEHDTHSIFDKYSLTDNAIYSIYKDSENGIWIGTYFGGVNYINSNIPVFEKYYQNENEKSFIGQRVREFSQDKNGYIWIGTEDSGINKFNPKTGEFAHISESRNFTNVHGLFAIDNEIGRASCRERVCQYVEVHVVARAFKNKT